MLARGAAGDPVSDNRGDIYLGVQAALADVQLIGINGLQVWATGSVKLNRALDADGVIALPVRMNWHEATVTRDSDHVLADLDIDSTIELQASGSAALNVSFSAGVIAYATSVSVTFATTRVSDGTVTIPEADVVSIDVEGVSVFVGEGGSFLPLHAGLDVTAINANGTGFLASGMSFKMDLARGATVSMDVNVTKGFAASQSEVTIAVNPANPDNLIVAPNDKDPMTGIFGTTMSRDNVWVSTNGGRTFERKRIPLPVGATASHGDPTLAFSRDGSLAVYAHLVDKVGGPAHGIGNDVHGVATAVSHDGGLTWTDTGVAGSLDLQESDQNGFVDTSTDANDKEFLAVGPDYRNPSQDRFALGWQRNGVIYASTSTDGIVWSLPVQLSNRDADPATHMPTGSRIDSIPTFGPNGEIYIVWEDYALAGVSRIMFDVSYDGGATWDVGAPPRLSGSFAGLDHTISTLQPPDTDVAAGPTRVIEVVTTRRPI